MTFKPTPLSLALAGLLMAPLSHSTELEPVMVSADFRPTAIEQLNNSISVIDDLKIEQRNGQHIENVLNLAPNINSAGGGSRNKYFQIRGIGERGQFTTPLNPSVGLMIDGVDYSRMGAAATLFDSQQVEILRGPQGTRFGANALAGVINIQSNEPTNTPEAHLESTVGSHNTKSAGMTISGPIIKDTLLGRLAIKKHTADGYIENDYLNRSNTQNQDELSARGKLKWLVDSDLTLDLTLMHFNIDNGYDAFSFDNDRTTTTDEPGKDTLKSDAFALKSTWKANPKTILETTLTHSNSNSLYSYDDDWTYDGQYTDGYSAKDNYARNRNNHSLEARFLSSEQGRIFNNTTDWVAGVYHLSQDENLKRTYSKVDSPSVTESSKYNTKNTAVYGQLDHHLNTKTTLITGLRVEQFSAEYKNSYGFNENTSETLLGGKLGLNHQINPAHLGFISLSRGYKAGGVNDDNALPQDKIAFDTETLWNLETGLNSSLMNNKLKTRLTAFYAQRDDQQVNSSTSEANDPSSFTIYLDNAAKGQNYGLEAEVDWLALSKLRLLGSLGLLNATFSDYTYVNPSDISQQISFNGRQQAHAPSYQFSLGAELYLNEYWTMAGNIEGKDAFYFSDSHSQKSTAYQLINANIEYAQQNWRMTLWARNLADTEYATRGFYFGIDPSTDYSDGLYTQQGEPRTVGLTVAYDY
jgi:outer membrane receptor protein involved in Fe transport